MVIQAKLTVNGVDFRDFNSVSLFNSIGENNASSRLDISVDNFDGRNKSVFVEGNTITLSADKDAAPTTVLFSGTVTEVKFQGKGSNNETIRVQARDWTNFLQQATIEPEVYTNQEISTIVTNLLSKYAPGDFTTTNVSTTGKTLARITFNQVNLFDALKQLAAFVNYTFYVDVNKDVHFGEKGASSSGVTLDNTNVLKAEFTTDVESIKNRIYVYGARQLVKAPQESFTGDGVGSVFTLSYEPHNTQVRVSGAEKKGGILQVAETTPSGVDYLVSFNDKQIVFVSGTSLGYSSIPGSLVQVLVDGQVSRPIIKLAEDQTSMGVYGRRTEVVTDENITDAVTARDIAKNQVNLKKDPAIQGKISCLGVFGVNPGDTIIVNLPDQNQSSKTYDVLEARYDFTSDTMRKEKVLEVKVSQRINDITDVLKNLINDVARLKAGEIDTTAVISRLQTGAGSMGLRVSEWNVRTRTQSNGFIVGHPLNGRVGSPGTIGGGAGPVVGSGTTSGLFIRYSGGDV